MFGRKKQFYALEKRWQNFAYVSFNDCVNDTLFQWIKRIRVNKQDFPNDVVD